MVVSAGGLFSVTRDAIEATMGWSKAYATVLLVSGRAPLALRQRRRNAPFAPRRNNPV